MNTLQWAKWVVCFSILATSVATADEIRFKKRHLTPRFFCEGANVGDFDQDGNLDVVSGPFLYAGPKFDKTRNIYTTEPSQPKGYSSNFLTFVEDINRDGWDDVIQFGFPGKEVWWYENPAEELTPDWKKHLCIPIADNESPTVTDITGDGKPEIVCSLGGYFGYAEPNWEKPTEPWTFHRLSDKSAGGMYTHGLGVGDVDGDGRMDLLEKNGWWQQPESLDGDPQWKQHKFQFTPDGGAQMYAYDVDGDGDNDVITSQQAHAYGLAWWDQSRDDDGNITFIKRLIIGEKPEQSPYGVAFSQMHSLDLVDMDGDGLKDIVTGKRYWAHNGNDPGGNDPAVLYWFQLKRTDEKTEFVPHKIDEDSGVGTQVIARDVSGDDRPDIIVGNKKGTFVHLQE
ncbi:MAG: VCBS repeat-containing protein [Pirellulales bacterium]